MWLVEEISNGPMSLSSVTQMERGPQVRGSRKQDCGLLEALRNLPHMSRSYRVQASSSFTHTMPVFLLAKSLENPICSFVGYSERDAGRREGPCQQPEAPLWPVAAGSMSPVVLIFFSPKSL